MSDHQHIRELAELATPFLVGQLDDATQNEEIWKRHKEALAAAALVPGVFQDPPPESNPLASAATIYLTATTALSPLLEDLAATHLSRRKQIEMPPRPIRPERKTGTGTPMEPGEDEGTAK